MTADAITRTARQVRLPGRDVIHGLYRATDSPANGRTYSTRCGETWSVGQHHAVLTTREANCVECARVGRLTAPRRRELALR